MHDNHHKTEMITAILTTTRNHSPFGVRGLKTKFGPIPHTVWETFFGKKAGHKWKRTRSNSINHVNNQAAIFFCRHPYFTPAYCQWPLLSRYRKVFWNSCDSFLPDTWNQTKFRASGLRNRNVLFREIFSRELLGPSTRDQKLPIFLLGMYWCSKKYTTVHVTLTQHFFTGYSSNWIESSRAKSSQILNHQFWKRSLLWIKAYTLDSWSPISLVENLNFFFWVVKESSRTWVVR